MVLPVVNDIAAGNTNALAGDRPDDAHHDRRADAAGADAVVPVEQTDGGVVHVSVQAAPEPGQHVRAAGEDVLEGQIILRSGTPARPRPDRAPRRGRPGSRPRRPQAEGGRAVDRRRARRAGAGARVRADRRLELRHAHRRRAGGGRHSVPRRRRARRRAPAHGDAGGPAGAGRRHHHDRRGEHGGVRHGQGGALPGRDDAVRQGRDAPGMPQGFGVLGEERVPVFTAWGTRSARWCRSTSSSPRRCGPWPGVPRRRGRRATCRRRPPSPGSRCPGRWSSRGSSSTATGSGSRVGRGRTCSAPWPRPTRWRSFPGGHGRRRG